MYGEKGIKTLLQLIESFQQSQYLVLSLQCHRSSPLICKRSETLRRYITNQPKKNMNEQLKELSKSLMLETLCPSLSTLVKVCLILPIGVESSFSQRKKITTKKRLRNCLGEVNLFLLKNSAIESQQILSEEEFNKLYMFGMESQEEELLFNVNSYCCIDLLMI